jgi:hypothetical protein
MLIFRFYKFKGRETLISQFLSFSWIFFGYKVYLHEKINLILQNKIDILLGLISIVIGIILLLNFLNLLKLNSRKTSYFTKFKEVFNFLFLNYSSGIFHKELFMSYKLLIYADSYETFIKILFISFNTIPLLFNSFIHNRLTNLPFNLYPNPIFLTTFTIFLNCFRIITPENRKYALVLDILCYIFLSLTFIYEIFILKVFSWQHILFLTLNILNIICIHYFNLFNFDKLSVKQIGIF